MSRIEYKFILIGNSGVGKTSILKFLSTGKFPEDTISTIGVDKKTLDVTIEMDENHKKVQKNFNILLFDTAGQEKFRAIALNYYKGSNGILLLYDITDRSSFDNIEGWIDSITESLGKNHDSKYVIILIGNKLDLVKEDESKREVTQQEAIDICNKFNLIWGGEQGVRSLNFDELNKLFSVYIKLVYKEVGEKRENKQRINSVNHYKRKTACCLT